MEQPRFRFTEDRHALPLVIWDNPPGLFVELNPNQLRKLAADLIEAARVSEQQHPTKKKG